MQRLKFWQVRGVNIELRGERRISNMSLGVTKW